MACKTCGKMNCYAHGGNVRDENHEKGVHPRSYSRQGGGTSDAGNALRDSSGMKKGGHFDKTPAVKEEHRRVLGESRKLPKPKLQGLAKGGKVFSDEKAKEVREKGLAILKKKHDEGHGSPESKERANKEWGQIEDTLKPESKRKKFAHGGETDMYSMDPDVPAMHGYAEGGEADMPDMDHEAMNDDLGDMVAGELLEAIEKKDKAGILEAIRALVMNTGGHDDVG